MASETHLARLSLSSSKETAQFFSTQRFDWMMAIVSIWWLGGLFIDGWAHSNIPQLETFFTPWHAALYSGFLAVAITLLVKMVQNLRVAAVSESVDGKIPALGTLIKNSLRENRWLRAIPDGYALSLLGIVVFAISGMGDLTWHLVFGIERSTEALLSPTHLGLALGIGFALSGPLRAAWRRSDEAPSWRQLGPAILSLTFTYSLLTFFTVYASPLIDLWPLYSGAGSPSRGITDILLVTGIMMGFVLLAQRRWRLPFGAFAVMLGLNGALMAAFHPSAIVVSLPTALLGGLVADVVYVFVRPSEKEPIRVHLFAFLVPMFFYMVYFIDLALVGPIFFHNGILWSVPFWAGAPVIAGVAGILLSYVMLPPARPVEKE